MVKNKDYRSKPSNQTKPKEIVEMVKGKIKSCENCKDTKEAKKCILDIVNKS